MSYPLRNALPTTFLGNFPCLFLEPSVLTQGAHLGPQNRGVLLCKQQYCTQHGIDVSRRLLITMIM